MLIRDKMTKWQWHFLNQWIKRICTTDSLHTTKQAMYQSLWTTEKMAAMSALSSVVGQLRSVVCLPCASEGLFILLIPLNKVTNKSQSAKSGFISTCVRHWGLVFLTKLKRGWTVTTSFQMRLPPDVLTITRVVEMVDTYVQQRYPPKAKTSMGSSFARWHYFM